MVTQAVVGGPVYITAALVVALALRRIGRRSSAAIVTIDISTNPLDVLEPAA